ncbi:MAG: hypothetical protein RMK30_06645 [Anaerolineae bacterium]|nr:hypothetical protein [Anaerolineae bacterium]MDW8102538.1 hypothetical protein [Anaerolineae bacterium]
MRAKKPVEDYRPMVEVQGCAEAWHCLEGSYGGYLGNVRTTWERVTEENRREADEGRQTPYLGVEIRCALIEASIHSLAKNIPPKLIAALAFICQMPDEHQCASALYLLAFRLSPDLYPEVLAAIAEILSVLARRTRRDLLSDFQALAPVIHALGGEQAVVETFQAIQDTGRWWPF